MHDVNVQEDRPTAKPAPRPDPPLDYTPRFGAGGPVSVRGMRLVVALLLVNTTLLGMSIMGPQLFPFLRGQWAQWQATRARERAKQAALALQQQCLDHARPPGYVVYDEDPVEAAKRLSDPAAAYAPEAEGDTREAPPGWVPPAKAAIPSYFPAYTDAIYKARVTGVTDPLLFLHGRTTPGGGRYVVSVHLGVRNQFYRRTDAATGTTRFVQAKSRTMTAHAWPAGPGGPVAAAGKQQRDEIGLDLPDAAQREVARVQGTLSIDQSPPIDYGNVVRFFAGQVDPADASHFTIPYEVDGRVGVIDGWLRDDGVKLRPREGSWSFQSNGQAWKLPTGPESPSAPAPAPDRP